jgi:hypothetical protein
MYPQHNTNRGFGSNRLDGNRKRSTGKDLKPSPGKMQIVVIVAALLLLLVALGHVSVVLVQNAVEKQRSSIAAFASSDDRRTSQKNNFEGVDHRRVLGGTSTSRLPQEEAPAKLEVQDQDQIPSENLGGAGKVNAFLAGKGNAESVLPVVGGSTGVLFLLAAAVFLAKVEIPLPF